MLGWIGIKWMLLLTIVVPSPNFLQPAIKLKLKKYIVVLLLT